MVHVSERPYLGPGLPLSDDYIARQCFQRPTPPPYWIPDSLRVNGSLVVTGYADVNNSLHVVGGDLTVNAGNLSVTGNGTITGTLDQRGSILNSTGNVQVGDNLVVTGTSNLQGAVDCDSTLNVDGATTLVGNVDIRGTISNSTGSVTIGDALVVTSAITGGGVVSLGEDTNVNGLLTASTLAVTGLINAKGGINNTTGNVQVSDNLVVTGTSNLQGAVDCDSNINCGGIVTSDNVSGFLELNGPAKITTSLTLVGSQTISSTLNVAGDFSVATSKLTVAASTGNTVIAGTLNLSGLLTHQFPLVLVQRVAAQSISSSVYTAINFDTETYDTHGFFTASSKVITVPTGLGGVYLMNYGGSFAANATGARFSFPALNDSTDTSAGLSGTIAYASRDMLNVGAGFATNCSGSFVLRLAAGDTVTLKVLQDSGSALNFSSGSFSLLRIGST